MSQFTKYPPAEGLTTDVEIIVDGRGLAIQTGVAGDARLDFPGTIVAVTMLADQVGSIVMDIYKAPYAAYPPTIANKITDSHPPTISGSNKSEDTTLTGWTTAFQAGDCFRFVVVSDTTITRCTLVLKIVGSGAC